MEQKTKDVQGHDDVKKLSLVVVFLSIFVITLFGLAPFWSAPSSLVGETDQPAVMMPSGQGRSERRPSFSSRFFLSSCYKQVLIPVLWFIPSSSMVEPLYSCRFAWVSPVSCVSGAVLVSTVCKYWLEVGLQCSMYINPYTI